MKIVYKPRIVNLQYSMVFHTGRLQSIPSRCIIQFNYILVYLRANLTAQNPITKLARVRKKKQQKTYKQNKNKPFYIIIIIIIIIIPRKIKGIINR
jgi:hypothetical protein